MEQFCKNCGTHASGNYCATCGQRLSVAKFDTQYLLRLFFGVFDFDRGFLKALQDAFLRPGDAVREYIDGKRVSFYNPIKFFLITGTLATVLINISNNPFDVSSDNAKPLAWILEFLELPGMTEFFEYSSRYFPFWTITGVPFFALFSYLLFIKSGRNYWENLIMNIYIASGQYILMAIMAPVLVWAPGMIVSSVYFTLNQAYNIWGLSRFYNVSTFKRFLVAVGAVIIPAPVMFFVNYLVFLVAPDYLWKLLDAVLV